MGEKFIDMLTSDLPSIEEIELKEKKEINDLINLLVPLYLKDLSKKLTTDFNTTTKDKLISLRIIEEEGGKINEKIAEKIVIEMQKMVKSKGWKLQYISCSFYVKRISISLSRFSNLDKFIASILDFSWLLPKKILID